ncbi:MAG: TraM recognition domain-containing protein [Methylobacteriaceae bacterium]|nr:TraM recognition domain-containing protein [Methylobacteriaceae bacterium]
MPPVLFVLDEFAQLGRLDAIEAALGIARGSGVQLWPFLQDLSQLKDLYPDRWQTFFTGAGALTFFAPKDGFTAEFVSRQCGQKSERMVSQNTRESDSDAFGHRFESSYGWSEGGFPLFRPEELREIPPQQMLCFVEPCAQPIFTSAPPYPWTRYGLGLDQNPYFRG